MPNYEATQLDSLFQALADPTRRAVLERLTQGSASVGELAQPYGMALPSFLQHLAVLERAQLVRSHKQGRVRTLEFQPEAIRTAGHWLERQRLDWERRLDQLDSYLNSLKESTE
jgi:DNA-binding transcriptional ArsR family regulator